MNTSKNHVKTFQIQFPLAVILLAVAVIVLCIISIGVSIWQIITMGIDGITNVFKYPFMIAISVFGIALVSSVLIKSEYVITDKEFISQFGFIKSKTALSAITSILLNTDTQKLTVYFGEEFTVLSFTKDWNEEFVRAILDANPNVSYSFTSSNTEEK